MAVTDSGIRGAAEFPATSWSVIRRAADPRSPEAVAHWQRLVELYWKPVYCVIRHARSASVADAKDLTQEFFATVVLGRGLVEHSSPARGSFRALLRTALSGFLVDTARTAGRQKRGSGQAPLSLDVGDDVGDLVEDPRGRTPEELFDLAWKRMLFAGAVAALERRLTAAGRHAQLAVFRRYYLDADAAPGRQSYADVGRPLGLSPSQVKHALTEARQELHALLVEAIGKYVDGVEDVAAELRDLFDS